VKTVTYKDTWDESFFPILDFMKSIGLTSRDPVKIDGVNIPPQKLIAALTKPGEPKDVIGSLRVELRGFIDGRRSKLVYYLGPVGYNEKWSAGVTAFTTGVGASIGVQMLGEGMVSRKGVVPPELIDKPKIWIGELGRRGIAVLEEKTDMEELT